MIKRLFLFMSVIMAICFYSCKKNTQATGGDTSLLQNISLDCVLPQVLHESSGLCFTDGNLWTFGDSGNPNSIYKIDTITGKILQTVTIQNYLNVDWEDITADSGYMYVGDFGNNNGNRTDLKILKIKKSDLLVSSSAIAVNAEAINFSYEDQKDFTPNSNTNFDCEALISFGENLYIFTKDAGDLQTRCYRLPKDAGNYTVTPLSTFNTGGKITAAAYNSSTNELALSGYMNKKLFPFIWFFKGFEGDNFFGAAQKIKEELTDNNTPWQVEGIDYSSAGRMFMSCESTPEIPASLYTIVLNFKF